MPCSGYSYGMEASPSPEQNITLGARRIATCPHGRRTPVRKNRSGGSGGVQSISPSRAAKGTLASVSPDGTKTEKKQHCPSRVALVSCYTQPLAFTSGLGSTSERVAIKLRLCCDSTSTNIRTPNRETSPLAPLSGHELAASWTPNATGSIRQKLFLQQKACKGFDGDSHLKVSLTSETAALKDTEPLKIIAAYTDASGPMPTHSERTKLIRPLKATGGISRARGAHSQMLSASHF